MKSSPEKYDRKFKTMMPKKTWTRKTAVELNQMACELGDHNADWVEQALEWAQRICNGENWEAICNNADTANWHRMILWKNGYYRIVGGSRSSNNNFPASFVLDDDCYSNTRSCNTVPLVVLKKK